ncbi:hypothetical protein LCGC14_0738810 [marine sediment metagenome]|uniref:Uncharacterized protein n=1 Tax=marine sediment metagenome TaxID=412755 RepID=A0A0F9SSC4_9ZZZZ
MIQPMGLCSLKAAAKEALPGKVQVKVLDAGGLETGEVAAEVFRYEPEVVGITTFTEARHKALAVARATKNIFPDALTLLGGVHATHTATQILDNYPFVDVVLIGEGEKNFVDFLISPETVKGIVYRGREGIKTRKDPGMIKDLDTLPFPDYSDLDLSKYIETEGPGKGQPLMAIETSRGCPYNCSFCSSRSVWGNIRYKSVKRVLDEIDYWFDRGYRYFSFIDDIFTIDTNRTIEICRGLINRSTYVTWKCQTRTDRVDDRVLNLMNLAGCRLIAFGVESGSPTVLDAINKKETPDDIKMAFELCRQHKIESVFNIIVGSPGETKDTLKETRNLIKECNPTHIATAALRAYPGSGIWNLGIEKGLFTEDILLTNQESIHYEGSLSINQMYRELIKFRILQAQLRGWRGWVELIRMGLRTVKETPMKLVRGVVGR